ncbi:MAG: hypothetical protein ACW960_03370 [Candidatus Thorarchaeota archaeon]
MMEVRRRELFVFGLMLGLIIAFTPMDTAAAEYTAIQLTDNDYNDGFGGVSDGYIVWIGGEGLDREIFLYDASTNTIFQITDNDYVDTIPKVHEGMVTWLGKPPDGVDYEVYLYDHNSGVTTRVTNNDLNENHPQVHEGLLTWYGWDQYVGRAEIYLYDSNNGQTIQITDNYYADYFPKIHNGQVAWHGWGGVSGSEIYLYDYASGVTTRVTENNYGDEFPQIHEGLVVWRALVDGIVKIFFYDTVSKITTHVEDIIYSYGFVLHDGEIAYVAPENPDFEIFLYDCFDGTKTQITYNGYNDYVSHLHAGKVVWIANGEIFLYDSATGIIDQVTDNQMSEAAPRLTSGFLAWMGSGGTTGSDNEIFIAGLASTSDVDFDPNTLNLESKGKWVTVYIELPVEDEYTAEAIDVSTLLLNGQIPAELKPYAIGDYDADGIIDLMVKFDRSAVQAILEVGEEVTVTITGTLSDGSQFEGHDIIRVICNS